MIKFVVAPLMAGLGVALAWLLVQRMSQDAMGVVCGTGLGVFAAVPVSLLLVALLRRRHHQPG
jgi:uncharacterized protein (TIGR03382 family)